VQIISPLNSAAPIRSCDWVFLCQLTHGWRMENIRVWSAMVYRCH